MAKTKKKAPKLADLSSEYWQLFSGCTVNPDKLADIKLTVTSIIRNRQRYEQVTATLGTMPWWFVALIHAMESGLRFDRHLHNGDPLSARTIHVPAGRPIGNPRGNPTDGPSPTNPFTWEESAEDILRAKSLNTWNDWTISAALYKLEQYNGWGYRWYHKEVLSPYLWSYTNHYKKGKYAADGKWDANLVSRQPGAAAILREMVDAGWIVPIDSVIEAVKDVGRTIVSGFRKLFGG